MKAAVLNKYNKKGAELVIKDVPIPKVGKKDVLVKIHTAGVNPLDNMIIRGDVKLVVPYRFPLVMGNEFVGIVEKVGKKVTRFEIGDRVYGRMPLDNIGAFAEYAAIDEASIAKVPEYLSDTEAACVPLTALTALQAFELMDPKPGETVFITGGTGSLGAMAIPIAKSMGLTVVTNGSAANRERVLALGADCFLDYKTQDYTKELKDVDYVLDSLGDSELKKEFQVLKDGGTLVSLRGLPNSEFATRAGMPTWKRVLFKGAGMQYDRLAAKRKQKYYFVFVHEDGEGLDKFAEIFAGKKIETSVDAVFPLDEVNRALAKVAAGKSKGKTVLQIS